MGRNVPESDKLANSLIRKASDLAMAYLDAVLVHRAKELDNVQSLPQTGDAVENHLADPTDRAAITSLDGVDPLRRDPLRALVSERVIMMQVRSMAGAGRATRPPLLTRFRSYHIALGLAAALVIALGSSLITIAALKSSRTVSVRFVLAAPEARSVSLVADFNEWSPEEHLLVRNPDSGDWELRVPLRKGRSYVYNFIIDGEHWLPDPSAAGQIDDGLGGLASFISL
jgi:hypothetical protein